MKLSDVIWILAVLAVLLLMVMSGAVVVLGLMNLFTYGVDWWTFGVAVVALVFSCWAYGELMGD